MRGMFKPSTITLEQEKKSLHEGSIDGCCGGFLV
jgi:hypothetical protein